ncbi:MAG TPA: phosphate acyltransferase PlsX [Candidatus Cloacimonadota bacterium]|nr:phosphate acyltransferase PlsX [Candidatus Cloacimonadota bacterium]
MRVAIDAFGSDKAPYPEVEGAVMAVKEEVCDEVILVGDESILRPELEKFFHDKQRVKIVHASQRITMDEHPATAVRSKKDSSMLRAVELHKSGEADAAVSAGSTGAFMAASLLVYGRIKGVSRPAIAITFPTQKHHEIILDVGANVDCDARNLLEFAHLGRIYYKYFFGAEEPRVSLLNIGEESAKGNTVSREAHKLLAEAKDLNFIGNIEGKDVLKGITDVIVCDGFVGNVMLKTVEGAIISIFDILKEQFNKDWIAKFGAMLSYPVYSYLKKKLDHTEYGGALLVGLNGTSIVSHGRSNAKAVKNAIRAAARISRSGFVQHSKEYFERFV